MSLNVPTHFAQEYTSLVQLKLQQQGSRLRNAVMVGGHVGKAAVAVEQVGAVNARKRTSRHADTPIIDTPADKRWVFPTDYEWGDMVDRQDRVRMIVDPTGAYVTNGSSALGRAIDDEIVDAFFGDAKTGENGTDTTTFPSAQIVAVTEGAAAATGLNIKKLKVARRILMENNVDVANDRLYCAVTAQQHENLLNEIQVTSQDFNTQPVLVDGLISRFLGFDFIHTELLEADGNAYRRVAAWAHSGMHIGVFDEIDAQVYPRPDKSNNIQVLVQGTFGATRLEEGKVVEIKCAEA
ncbi:MAG: hypothetical protein GY791_08320 [Alphaproteobacteria bacterium]|nr:hypothetical protein [Alphaproteobacteria bacterium]